MILSFALSTVGSGSPDKPTSVRLGMTNRFGTRISRNDALNSGTVAYRVDRWQMGKVLSNFIKGWVTHTNRLCVSVHN
ncbi:hypothetical protein BDV27DRAFT_126452 [Aspergillus caelatus]|uniref:Uncharacterized protein n=1 Tax=Aspergillus caelatus TaxID=61420 RepID=A0A5N7A982_9EURO|nr:uncharacterized protein BDV27DRAFT_126452 [Aspergillus caelatus]KAE8365686.1 hypothetical protein BDV27DRAFT_126452 [Aspergillus caelatus]